MAVVTHTVLDVAGVAQVGGRAVVTLYGATDGTHPEGHDTVNHLSVLGRPVTLQIGANGVWTADLKPNFGANGITSPVGTLYMVVEYDPNGVSSAPIFVNVPPAGGRVEDLIVPSPGTPAVGVYVPTGPVGGDLAGALPNPVVPGLALLIPLAQRGVPNGVATLDGTGHIPMAQLSVLDGGTP